MSEFLTVKTDIEKAQKALAGTNKSLTSISKQALGIMGRGAIKQIKGVIRADLNKGTGAFVNAYTYHVKKDGSSMAVYPRALGKRNWAVGLSVILNYGADAGRSHATHIRPRGFIEAGDNYIQGRAYEAEIDKMIDTQLKKYWG